MKIALLLQDRSADELCRLIEERDMSMQAIAAEWGCTKRQLQLWIDADDARYARAREARQNAADWCDRQAEKVLLDLNGQSTVSDVARARELAQHYRWRARIRNPATHGEKIQVDLHHKGDPSKMSDEELAAIASRGAITIEGTAEVVLDDAAPPAGQSTDC